MPATSSAEPHTDTEISAGAASVPGEEDDPGETDPYAQLNHVKGDPWYRPAPPQAKMKVCIHGLTTGQAALRRTSPFARFEHWSFGLY